MDRQSLEIELGRLNESLNLLKEHLERFPEDEQARLQMAEVNRRRNEYSIQRDQQDFVEQLRLHHRNGTLPDGWCRGQENDPVAVRKLLEAIKDLPDFSSRGRAAPEPNSDESSQR